MSNSNGNGKPPDEKPETTTAGGGRPGTLKKEWAAPFLKAMAEHANVAHSCRLAEVSQTTVYRDRDVDDEFKVAWDEALEEGISKLEIEARRRALYGVRDNEEVKYSDTLTIFLLKAHRPKVYRENLTVDMRHSGDIDLRFAGMTQKQGREFILERIDLIAKGSE